MKAYPSHRFPEPARVAPGDTGRGRGKGGFSGYRFAGRRKWRHSARPTIWYFERVR